MLNYLQHTIESRWWPALRVETSSVTNVSCQICMKDLDSTAGNTDKAAIEPTDNTLLSGPAGNVTRPLSLWKFVRSWWFFLWCKCALIRTARPGPPSVRNREVPLYVVLCFLMLHCMCCNSHQHLLCLLLLCRPGIKTQNSISSTRESPSLPLICLLLMLTMCLCYIRYG